MNLIKIRMKFFKSCTKDGVMSFKVSRKCKEILKNVSMAFDEFLTIELISLKSLS